MKDKLKEWLEVHERLYWFIVVALAVFAFGLITAIGCGKLEKANAAETYVAECDAIYNTLVEKRGLEFVQSNPKYCVVYDNRTSHLYLCCNPDNYPITYLYDGQRLHADWEFYIYYDMANDVCDMYLGSLKSVYFDEILYMNHNTTIWDSSWNEVQNSLGYSTYVECPSALYKNWGNSVYTYLVNGPYLSYVSHSNYNGYAEDRDLDLENSEYNFTFDILGQPMEPENGYVGDFQMYVWLPSKLWFEEQMESNPIEEAVLGNAFYNAFLAAFDQWEKNIGEDEYSELWVIRFDKPFASGTTASFRLDYLDLFEYIQETYATEVDGEMVDFDLASYYGCDADSPLWLNYYRPLIMSNSFIQGVNAMLYTHIDDTTVYYGRMTSAYFLPDYSEAIMFETNEDILEHYGDMSLVKTDGYEKALQDALSNAVTREEGLQNKLEDFYNSENTFADYSTSDVWSSLESTAQGLLGVSQEVLKLSAVVGVVFGFLPVQVGGMLSALFVICVFTAIIRFIRG